LKTLCIKRLPDCRIRRDNRRADNGRVSGVVLVPDYVAIGILIVCAVWAVADWIPRGKL
jgi:hypothetical protein